MSFDLDNFSLKPLDNVFSATAGLLFVLGIVANIKVLKRVYSALRREHQRNPPRHVFVYIGALVITDCLLLVNIPFVVTDHTTGEWIFGEGLCKFMYCNESINKLLTSFILAALSFDRLMTVRKILPPPWRSVRTACRILACSIAISLCLVYPLYRYTKTVDLIETFGLNVNNASGQSVYKCVFEPPDHEYDIGTIFTLYIFVCGFCLPAFFILGSYGTILYFLVVSGYFSLGNRAQGQQITWYILLLVIIYLSCWTPYWVITVIMVQLDLQSIEDSFIDTESSQSVTYMVLFIHLLPYLNAVLNPIAYGCLTNKPSLNINLSVTKNFSRNETWSPEMVPLGQCNAHTDPVDLENVETPC